MSLGHKPKPTMSGTTPFTISRFKKWGMQNYPQQNCSYSDTQIYVSKCILCFKQVHNDQSWWLSLRARIYILYYGQSHWGETLEQGTELPTAPRVPQRWLPTAPSVCALGWVKYREHISLLVILCRIVYVTNKIIIRAVRFTTREFIHLFVKTWKWVVSKQEE